MSKQLNGFTDDWPERWAEYQRLAREYIRATMHCYLCGAVPPADIPIEVQWYDGYVCPDCYTKYKEKLTSDASK